MQDCLARIESINKRILKNEVALKEMTYENDQIK